MTWHALKDVGEIVRGVRGREARVESVETAIGRVAMHMRQCRQLSVECEVWKGGKVIDSGMSCVAQLYGSSPLAAPR